MLLGHTTLEPGSRGGGPVEGDVMVIESAVAIDIDRTGMTVIGVIEREGTGIAEVDMDPVGMREDDTGEPEGEGDESLIEIGLPKE
jgi:hypothetical protein